MSVINTVTFTTSSRLPPASSRSVATFSSTFSVWARASPSAPPPPPPLPATLRSVLQPLLRRGPRVALPDDVALGVHRDLPRDVDGPAGRGLDPGGEGPPAHRRRQLRALYNPSAHRYLLSSPPVSRYQPPYLPA